LVLLDEPAAGLNESETTELLNLLRRIRSSGIALLVVDHKIDFIASLCDRVAVLATGRLIATGNAQSVWHDPAVIDAYVGRPWSG
jgi:branched-chain amino acid transport system ATP-binding protein